MHLPVIVLLDKTIADTAKDAIAETFKSLDEELMASFPNDEFDSEEEAIGEREQYFWYVGGVYSGLLNQKASLKELMPCCSFPGGMTMRTWGNNRIVNGHRPDGNFEDDAQIVTKKIKKWYLTDYIEMWSEEDNEIGFEEGKFPRVFDFRQNPELPMVGNAWAIVVDYNRP